MTTTATKSAGGMLTYFGIYGAVFFAVLFILIACLYFPDIIQDYKYAKNYNGDFELGDNKIPLIWGIIAFVFELGTIAMIVCGVLALQNKIVIGSNTPIAVKDGGSSGGLLVGMGASFFAIFFIVWIISIVLICKDWEYGWTLFIIISILLTAFAILTITGGLTMAGISD